KVQRFGAALSGRLPEFDVAAQERQEKLSTERKQAFLLDNRGALRAVRAGRPEDAVKLFQNRIGEINRLGGDPSQSMKILSMLEADDIAGVTAGLEQIDNRAVDEGILKPLTFGDTVEAQRLALDREKFEAEQAKTPDREIIKDVEGVSRFVDTGDVVLPGAETRLVEKLKREADEALAKANAKISVEDFDKAQKLRKEFTSASSEFAKIRDSFGRVKASIKDPSASGDLALIFNFMKMLDPGSVVRESEFATAQNAAGVPDRMRAQYNKFLRGERMEEGQRKDFVDRAGALFASQSGIQDGIVNRFNLLADKFKIDRDVVTTDISPGIGLEDRDIDPGDMTDEQLMKALGL
ncbi:MAG: hypothetical protein KAI73_08535, partial [Rhodospirillaceae bacterium]|nr:hypothetical protein [Rhodospirillaceae bacterium]